jgi:hypothetical protein
MFLFSTICRLRKEQGLGRDSLIRLSVEACKKCHSERSREWSGWGSRDMDGKAGG